MKQDNTEIPTPDLSGLPLVMVRDTCEDPWKGPFRLLSKGCGINRPYALVSIDQENVSWYHFAKPYTPPAKRPMTHAEIFKAIREGAVIIHKTSDVVRNGWLTNWLISEYKICYSYTGAPTDVWQEMEVEE